MKCEACDGSGDGLAQGDGKCSICRGTGTVCDTCGESCPQTLDGPDICADCEAGD